MRIASGARRENRSRTVRRNGDNNTTETVSATNPRTSSPAPATITPARPGRAQQGERDTAGTIPGTVERWSGGGGAVDRPGPQRWRRVIARAGRRSEERGHDGENQTDDDHDPRESKRPTTWWALDSRVGR